MVHICTPQTPKLMQHQEDVIIHRNKRFEHITYEGHHLAGRIFQNCTFFKCNLKGSTFEDSSFDKCLFDDCDISLMKMKDTSFSGIQVKNSKALGVMWLDADAPFSIQFTDSRISFCSFYGKALKKVKFINCIADEVDFSECNLTEADFAGTDLRNARFFNTNLTKANFVGATNYFIDIQSNKIAKAKFSLPEAISFLHALGIELVEERGE